MLANGVQNHHQNHNHNHNASSTLTETTTVPPCLEQLPDPEPECSHEKDAQLPPPPPLSAVAADLHSRVHSFLAESHPPDSLLARVQEQTRISLSVIERARAQYKISELSLSYNGGKDCLVLLILFLAGLHPLPGPAEGGISTIPAIYALPPDPFPLVEDFVRSSSRMYHLSLTRYTTEPPKTTLRSAFASYLTLNPNVKAIFVGTRRTDPHGAKLTHFDRTDHGWPDFMRIHPVIDWHYAEIWAFIRRLGIDYCSLYDQGFTSLGGTSNTHPNPKLKTAEDANDQRYRPAYELMDDQEERLGRH